MDIRKGWYFRARGGSGFVYGWCEERLDNTTILAYCRSAVYPQGESGGFRIANIDCIISEAEYHEGFRRGRD